MLLQIIRQHSSSLTILTIFLFFAAWISDSQLLSDIIFLYGISPIFIAIILNKRLKWNSATQALISLNTLKIFSFLTFTFILSATISSPTTAFNSELITNIAFALTYAFIFNFVATPIYATITGKKGRKVTKKDLLIVFFSFFAIGLTDIATDYLFKHLPFLAPLYLLLSTIVFLSAFVLQATLIFARNNQFKNNIELE